MLLNIITILVVNCACSILDLQAAFSHKILLVRDINIKSCVLNVIAEVQILSILNFICIWKFKMAFYPQYMQDDFSCSSLSYLLYDRLKLNPSLWARYHSGL